MSADAPTGSPPGRRHRLTRHRRARVAVRHQAVETVAIGDTSVIPESVRDQIEALDGRAC